MILAVAQSATVGWPTKYQTKLVNVDLLVLAGPSGHGKSHCIRAVADAVGQDRFDFIRTAVARLSIVVNKSSQGGPNL